MGGRLGRLEDLNGTLNPKEELSGVFLPVGSQKRFNVTFLAEMPSMNEPREKIGGSIPNFGVTARDMFLQQMMTKYGVAGSYVTDIVKKKGRSEKAEAGRGKDVAAVSLARNRNHTAEGHSSFREENLRCEFQAVCRASDTEGHKD